MSIRRGHKAIKRDPAKNYITKEAQARFDEVVKPYQNQGLNALKVDSFEVLFFYKAVSTIVCSCQETEVASTISSQENTNVPANFVNPESKTDQHVKIDYRRPLFGSVGDSANANDYTETDEFALDDDDEIDDGQPATSQALFSSGTDCGVCYRSGLLPGYRLYGYENLVFTPRDITDSYGYHKDVFATPHVLNKLDAKGGYTEFEIKVPKYFKEVKVSVRNNLEILDDVLLTEFGFPLTFSDLKASAGLTIRVRVTADRFTHFLVRFDLGVEPVLANLSQLSKSTDWTLFDTIGNVNIILPNNIPLVSNSDVIFVPSKNMSFKISDVTYMQTAKGQPFEWSTSTRVLQPQESLKRIHQARKLY